MLKISKQIKFAKKIFAIEKIRRKIKRSNFKVNLQDFGAGSKFYDNSTSVSAILRHSTSGMLKSVFISVLCKAFKKKKILELGTNLGFTSFYLSAFCPEAEILTIEGDPVLNKYARRVARVLGVKNVRFLNDNFDKILSLIAKDFEPDFVFIDGNHRYFPAVRYFLVIERNVSGPVVLVFDDVFWSGQMFKAWLAMKSSRKSFKFVFFNTGIIKLKPKKAWQKQK